MLNNVADLMVDSSAPMTLTVLSFNLNWNEVFTLFVMVVVLVFFSSFRFLSILVSRSFTIFTLLEVWSLIFYLVIWGNLITEAVLTARKFSSIIADICGEGSNAVQR